MAWNQSGGDNGGKRRSATPLTIAGWWSRWQQRWRSSQPRRRAWYAGAALGAALLWLLSGCYRIEEGQRGVLQRFGAYAGERGPGAGWHLPWPIEAVRRVDLGRLYSAEFQARMFSADTALLNVSGSIQYRFSDARAALNALRDTDAVVGGLGESLLREQVARQRVDALIGGTARGAIVAALVHAAQERLDALGAGVHLVTANLTDVQVPEQVLPAQRDAAQAREDRERMIREAQGYAADLVPRAQGVAQRERLEAQADKLKAVATAEGDAARFEPVLAAYARAPEITRNRLYIETMEFILARAHKLVIDGKGSANTFNLPLDKLFDSATVRGTGALGAIEAPAGSAHAAPGAPGAVGAAGTSGVAAGSPAAATGPAAAPASAGAAASAAASARDRERGER